MWTHISANANRRSVEFRVQEKSISLSEKILEEVFGWFFRLKFYGIFWINILLQQSLWTSPVKSRCTVDRLFYRFFNFQSLISRLGRKKKSKEEVTCRSGVLRASEQTPIARRGTVLAHGQCHRTATKVRLLQGDLRAVLHQQCSQSRGEAENFVERQRHKVRLRVGQVQRGSGHQRRRVEKDPPLLLVKFFGPFHDGIPSGRRSCTARGRRRGFGQSGVADADAQKRLLESVQVRVLASRTVPAPRDFATACIPSTECVHFTEIRKRAGGAECEGFCSEFHGGCGPAGEDDAVSRRVRVEKTGRILKN